MNLLMMVLIDLPVIQFTSQYHVSGYVCRVWHLGFFLLKIEMISIAKLLIIVHFFVWKHKKETLSYIHTKFEGDKNNIFFFFSNLFCGSTRFFSAPTVKITWAWQVDAPEITWYEEGQKWYIHNTADFLVAQRYSFFIDRIIFLKVTECCTVLLNHFINRSHLQHSKS